MWLKAGDRENVSAAKDRRKVLRSALPNTLVCVIGKLKSFPTIYLTLTKADVGIMNNSRALTF